MSTRKAPEPPHVVRLAVANGALLEAPMYESHQRGTNWLAVIDIDGKLPGGLSRSWMPKAKGECLYLIEHLSLFDPVEFGADYTTGHGNRHYHRWYGVVTAITDGYILVEECLSGVKAVLRAKVARESTDDRVRALEAQRDAMVEQAAKLEAEITDLKAQSTLEESTVPNTVVK